MALTGGASYVARTAAVNPNQAQEILVEAIEHDGFSHIDFLTQCPTWNKDAKQYVPYVDIQQNEEYGFDIEDRREAGQAMYEAEGALYDGTVLTGRFYHDEDRPSYGVEKRSVGEMPETPLAERYFDESYEWERSYDMLAPHK
jgi:pyruvate ferredoxin oxidoreductase beta subunit